MKPPIHPLVLAALCFSSLVETQTVPPMISYQGRVTVSGSPVNGTAYFKFALVDGDGTTASATYWSNDGTSTSGGEPTTGVALPVSSGLYAVLLGDMELGMVPIPATVFAEHSTVRLRVWFSQVSEGAYQLLSPDHRIVAMGYAMLATTVPDGSITSAKLAVGAVGTGQIAAHSITSTELANGAVGAAQLMPGAAAANLNASGQAGVPSGAVLLSVTEENATLIEAGYVKIGVTQVADSWRQRATPTTLAGRSAHSTVWTGSEMIVWGGMGSGDTRWNDGGRYSPTTDAWLPVTSTGAPVARDNHTAIWTGSEMIVWGGWGDGYRNDGGRYNPQTDSWTPVTTASAPAGRMFHTAVWTGSSMVIWGGDGVGGQLNNGGRYDPTTDTWTPVTMTGALSGRIHHTAVWTGSEVVIWGGYSILGYLNDGARYNPVSDSWLAMTASAPTARSSHTAVWTGSAIMIWGGERGSSPYYLNDGSGYHLSTSSWIGMSGNGAPTGRPQHSAVWTGSEMIVWGGNPGGSFRNDGGRYNPVSDNWTAVTTTGAPPARALHTAVWIGNEMIVWGGYCSSGYLADTWTYMPGKLFLYLKP